MSTLENFLWTLQLLSQNVRLFHPIGPLINTDLEGEVIRRPYDFWIEIQKAVLRTLEVQPNQPPTLFVVLPQA